MAYYSSQSKPANTNQTSIGGISAVNPQAKGDYQSYIDASYNAAKSRLDPIFDQQNDSFQQSMVDRGIPVGGEAYNKATQQIGQNQNDAYSQAAFNAMGFGLGAQNQEFGQDAQRSGLANALLSQKWGTDLGWGNNQLGWGNNKLGFAGLNEQGRQFDNSYMQRGYEFDSTLGENARQFDAGQDFSYWNQGNQFDFMRDRAASDDYRYGNEQDRQDYYDQRSAGQYDDAMMMALLGMGQAPSPYYQDPTSAYNAQLGSWNQQYASNAQLWGDMMKGGGAAAASDIRLKQDIQPLGQYRGQNIYRWNWNDEAKRLGIDDPTVGVIAQEVDPAYVVMHPDGYLAVNYSALFGGA